MKYDVIIPALNEEVTIGNIVYSMTRARTVRNVHVMIDDMTTDQTDFVATTAGGITHSPGITGKGQLVKAGLELTETEYIALSDGDYITFNPYVMSLAAPYSPRERCMRLLVPRLPSHSDWARSGFPVPFNSYAWAWNTGLRSFPRSLAEGLELHGYLTETQLNNKARAEGYGIDTLYCGAVRAPLRFSKTRMTAMEEDRKWGLANGVFTVPPE